MSGIDDEIGRLDAAARDAASRAEIDNEFHHAYAVVELVGPVSDIASDMARRLDETHGVEAVAITDAAGRLTIHGVEEPALIPGMGWWEGRRAYRARVAKRARQHKMGRPARLLVLEVVEGEVAFVMVDGAWHPAAAVGRFHFSSRWGPSWQHYNLPRHFAQFLRENRGDISRSRR